MIFDLPTREAEASQKLASLRAALPPDHALRLRGSDWFSWVTAGASNTVLLTTDTGVAELMITAEEAWVLTDPIEAQRLSDEELPPNFNIQVDPWAQPAAREASVRRIAGSSKVMSDRPRLREQELPAAMYADKRKMRATEITRYREVGRLASEAMREVMTAARHNWSEYQLAGAGAEALWARGLHPALTLAASATRMAIYRHPTASAEQLGHMAMLVFCARGFGLFANLTRFVSFGPLPREWKKLQQQVSQIEAEALDACRPSAGLHEIYHTLHTAYRAQGHDSAINEHHQGGTTGYMAREVVATPETTDKLVNGSAVAWNPSLRGGAKIEDTFIVTAHGLQNMTYDANWPHITVSGRQRPDVLEQ